MTQPAITGIDVSSKTLQVSKIVDGKPIDSEIGNSMDGIRTFLDTEPEGIHYVFEATGVYSRKLEFALSERGLTFSKVNPVKIKGFIRAVGSLTKNDKQDARHIRLYGEKIAPSPDRPVGADRIERERTRQMVTKFTKMLQDLDNQLHTLDQEPLPFDSLRSSIQGIKDEITEQKTIQEARLGDLEPQDAKPVKKLMQTVPGIGVKIAQSLFESVGGMESFDDPKALVKFLGLAPVTSSSGTSVKLKHGICRTSVPHLRAKLYVGTTAAVRYDKNCKELYERLRAKGKPKKVARVAVMHKIVRMVFAVLKSNTPYDPDWEEKRKNINQK